MKLVDVLEKLSNACGVAGREEEIRDLMKKLLEPNVDEIKEDKLGNVIGVKKGKKDAPTVMLAAHMDEIGLMVKNITKEGFIQFAKIGGIDDRILIAQKVIVHTDKEPIAGIVGSKPPHILEEEEKKKVIEADELFIDVGANDQKDAQKMGIRVGDAVSFDIKFTRGCKLYPISKVSETGWFVILVSCCDSDDLFVCCWVALYIPCIVSSRSNHQHTSLVSIFYGVVNQFAILITAPTTANNISTIVDSVNNCLCKVVIPPASVSVKAFLSHYSDLRQSC